MEIEEILTGLNDLLKQNRFQVYHDSNERLLKVKGVYLTRVKEINYLLIEVGEYEGGGGK